MLDWLLSLFKRSTRNQPTDPPSVSSLAFPSRISEAQSPLPSILLVVSALTISYYFFGFKHRYAGTKAAEPSENLDNTRDAHPSAGSSVVGVVEGGNIAQEGDQLPPQLPRTISGSHDGDDIFTTSEDESVTVTASGSVSSISDVIEPLEALAPAESMLPEPPIRHQPARHRNYSLVSNGLSAGPSIHLDIRATIYGYGRESMSLSPLSRRVTPISPSPAAVNHLSDVLSWLCAIDQKIDHEDIRQLHCESTGQWLLDDQLYRDWKSNGSVRALHLSATVACGKTILMSTVIDDISRFCEKKPANTFRLAYFYFDARHRYQCEHLVRSLIHQLCSVDTPISPALERLWGLSNNGRSQPSLDEWTSCLHRIIEESGSLCYIIVDALDECLDTAALEQFLVQAGAWLQDGVPLRIMVSSRPSENIGHMITTVQPHLVPLNELGIQADLTTYLRKRLEESGQWSSEQKEEIVRVLLQKANGRFQWALCQIDRIMKYQSNTELERALRRLPRTLGDTYGRILARIPPAKRLDANRVFQCLIYSKRPLTLTEMREVLAINLDDWKAPFHDPSRRCTDEHEVLELCPTLLTTIRRSERDAYGNTITVPIVALSHTSIQDYLLSNHIASSRTLSADFLMNDEVACRFLHQACELYLLHHGRPGQEIPSLSESFDFCGISPEHVELVRRYPLVEYAAWMMRNHVDEEQRAVKPPAFLTASWKRIIGQLRAEQEAEDSLAPDASNSLEQEEEQTHGLAFDRMSTAVHAWVRPEWAFRENPSENGYKMAPHLSEDDFWRSIVQRFGDDYQQPSVTPPNRLRPARDPFTDAIKEQLAAINSLSGDAQFDAMVDFMETFGLTWDDVQSRTIAVVGA